MIEQNKLRIGNWVTAPAFELPFKVDFMALTQYKHLEPVLLTEEWLLKSGFEDWGKKNMGEYEEEHRFALYNAIDGTGDFMVCFNESTYGGKTEKEITIRIDDDSIYIGYELKYVYQLQNLYFALTENELPL